MARDVRDDPVMPGDPDDVTVLRDRVESSEATIATLIDRLDAVGVSIDLAPGGDVRTVEPAAGSRRHLLKLAGAAIVAGGVASTADGTRVSAATDDVMQVGVRHFATNITRLEYGTGPTASAAPGCAAPARRSRASASVWPATAITVSARAAPSG